MKARAGSVCSSFTCTRPPSRQRLPERSFKRRIDHADVNAFVARARNHAAKSFADAVGERNRRNALHHGALDFAQFFIGFIAVGRDRGEVRRAATRPWS